MVMTFALYPLSHYNSIIEPCARFLLSLLEGLTVTFPSHFILLFMDVYKDTATHDKLIFPLSITKILCHFSVSYPESPHFSVMCAINVVSTEAATDRDVDSSNFFRSILIRFFYFCGWCDPQGGHGST